LTLGGQIAGETPINHSVTLYVHLKEKHPEFVEELEKKVGAFCAKCPRLGSGADKNQNIKYQLFHTNGPRDQTGSPGTTVLQAYGQHVLDDDDTETARRKIEAEISRLPGTTWKWENQSEVNQLGDLRVFRVLPGKLPPFPLGSREKIPQDLSKLTEG